jgi:hypothetical protein
MIETASISPEDVKKRMSKYKQREASLKIELKRLKARLDNLPSGTALKRNTELLQSTMEAIYRNSTEFSKMSFDEKRKLAQFAFSGKDQDGKRSGVYVKKDNDGFSYTITGVLGHSNLTGFLPLEDWQARGLLGIEDDNYNPLGGVKQKVSGGCN